jgi:membrane-associated two-gene conflict system component 1 (EACC1)
MGTGRFEMVVEASSSRFDANDTRWIGQVTDLHDTLRVQGADVSKTFTPVAGRKGGIEEIIVALGTAGVFSAAVTAFRAWLARDRGRSLRIRTKVDGKEKVFEVSGTAADDATLKELMQIAVGEVGKS